MLDGGLGLMWPEVDAHLGLGICHLRSSKEMAFFPVIKYTLGNSEEIHQVTGKKPLQLTF